MKDCTVKQLEAYRPTEHPLFLVEFCLSALYRDKEHKFHDDINEYLTYEELLGTLLKARDYLRELVVSED